MGSPSSHFPPSQPRRTRVKINDHFSRAVHCDMPFIHAQSQAHRKGFIFLFRLIRLVEPQNTPSTQRHVMIHCLRNAAECCKLYGWWSIQNDWIQSSQHLANTVSFDSLRHQISVSYLCILRTLWLIICGESYRMTVTLLFKKSQPDHKNLTTENTEYTEACHNPLLTKRSWML